MPVLTVCTNVLAANVPANLKVKLLEVISKSLGKPASYIAVHIQPDQDLTFGGDSEPAALCSLVSIGALSVESNKKHSKAIMDVLQQTLRISPEKTYITFLDVNKANIGYNGTTFDDLM